MRWLSVVVQNRMNVLLSRAKHGMFILGNDETLAKASQPPPGSSRRPAAPMWGNVLGMLRERRQIGDQLEVSSATAGAMGGRLQAAHKTAPHGAADCKAGCLCSFTAGPARSQALAWR